MMTERDVIEVLSSNRVITVIDRQNNRVYSIRDIESREELIYEMFSFAEERNMTKEELSNFIVERIPTYNQLYELTKTYQTRQIDSFSKTLMQGNFYVTTLPFIKEFKSTPLYQNAIEKEDELIKTFSKVDTPHYGQEMLYFRIAVAAAIVFILGVTRSLYRDNLVLGSTALLVDVVMLIYIKYCITKYKELGNTTNPCGDELTRTYAYLLGDINF